MFHDFFLQLVEIFRSREIKRPPIRARCDCDLGEQIQEYSRVSSCGDFEGQGAGLTAGSKFKRPT